MKARPSLLLHPLFIFGIVVLLLNDISWKYQFHNWFTGKLSDFTGMFVFPVFLFALFPFHKKIAFIASGLFFIWWKSSLSESFITTCNESLPFAIGRVVDYSDLFALIMLPFAYYLKPLPARDLRFRTAYINLMLLFCPFVFCNTSMAKHALYYPYQQNEIRFNEQYVSSKTRIQILQKFEEMGISYRVDSVHYYPVRDYDFYYNISAEKDSVAQWQRVPNNKDSALFIKRESGEFYLLPQYILDGDTLLNVELTIYKNSRQKKSTSIFLESFQTNSRERYDDFYNSRLHKKYKKHFKALFN